MILKGMKGMKGCGMARVVASGKQKYRVLQGIYPVISLSFSDIKETTYIMEFKVRDSKKEKDFTETVNNALAQIWEKKYAAALLEKGIPKERIREYGFAFEGKKVWIDGGGIQRVEEILEGANFLLKF